MIVINTNNIVICSGVLIERVNAQGEENLIKVVKNLDNPHGFYYIGTPDRDTYTIIDGVDAPNDNERWLYIDGNFILIEE